MKAISIEVYHGKHDCTNGGISSRYNELLLVCDRGNYIIDEDNLPENLVKVVTRNIFGQEYKHLEPYNKSMQCGWMNGGNIGYTSDSRFSELSNGYPLTIHDREESQELNDRLSR